MGFFESAPTRRPVILTFEISFLRERGWAVMRLLHGWDWLGGICQL